MTQRILITGCQGYLGRQLSVRLAQHAEVFGIDIHDAQPEGVTYQKMDIRSAALSDFIGRHHISHVIHLASIVQPSRDRQRDYDIDVNGTENLLKACINHQVAHLTVTSSGAAYGYHADNAEWLRESDPLRGNRHFSYSYHKRLVEEMLAAYRVAYPELQQLILRPGTVLGAETNNLITDLFRKDKLLAVKGSPSPFVFIWDQDVVDIITEGVSHSKSGQFNLAGDGALSVHQIADILGKDTRDLPAWLLKSALRVGKLLRMTQYGPEQLDFLRYRPVLANYALKFDFGYIPKKTSLEVFEYYASQQGLIPARGCQHD
ncbi:SDR family oxidoreductase [Photobacterium sp. 2_MG-2023]|uniref:SDR family oxidoreductase n=1 Tax=Photobacterium sp. 2_MG-2023 TaxID=3062663 RepID=UPI0026E201DA|nr:SDR family oxidoreductase [Photobacterium sp. 2_MG-2023]MDO6580747.1 SDR family oxidoreductase [Photobacterium sp. 2_MG-2023]